MPRPSPKLIREWYAKIKEADPSWVDVEGGRDLNVLHASTLPGGDGTRGAAFVRVDLFEILNIIEDKQGSTARTQADHPTAIYWRLVASAAHELPRNYKHRAFIVEAATEMTIAEAARKHELSADQANRVWWAFLRRATIPKQTNKAHAR